MANETIAVVRYRCDDTDETYIEVSGVPSHTDEEGPELSLGELFVRAYATTFVLTRMAFRMVSDVSARQGSPNTSAFMSHRCTELTRVEL